MKPPPPRENDEELAVFDLASFMKTDRRRGFSTLAGLYLDAVVDRLDAGTTFAPGARIVTCAVLEGQTHDKVMIDKLDREGFAKGPDGLAIYPVGALKARAYVSLHETARTKPKADWILLYERADGTSFYLLTRGEAVSRVFAGNLEVPFGASEETERWLVCQSDALSEEGERLAKRAFEERVRSPAIRALKALVSSGYEVSTDQIDEIIEGVDEDVDR